MVGMDPDDLAPGFASCHVLADFIYGELDRKLETACDDIRNGRHTKMIEDVVYYSIVDAGLISGLANGRNQSAIAHKFYLYVRTFFTKEGASFLHGELVAIGLVAQLHYNGDAAGSEAFAKRLLTESLLQALYDNKDAAYSCFDVKFSPDVLDENVFRFDVIYSQTVKEEERQSKGASVFALRFNFGYDLKKHDFGVDRVDNDGKCWRSHQPNLEYLGINGKAARSNFLNFDDRSMERVWQHPYWESRMCRGKEKILREEKKAVAEKEKRENSEKSKEGLGSEKEEGNWDDVFAVRSNFLNSDERSMERVRRHPCLEGTMCQGKEKISGEGKEAVDEEKQENPEKKQRGFRFGGRGRRLERCFRRRRAGKFGKERKRLGGGRRRRGFKSVYGRTQERQSVKVVRSVQASATVRFFGRRGVGSEF